MTYADVKAINPCLKAACQTSCEAQVSVSLWTEDVCSADAPGATGTAGSGGTGQGGRGGSSGAAGSAGGGGSTGAAGTGGAGGGPAPKHSGCAVGSGGSGATCVLGLLAFWIAVARRRRGADPARTYAHIRIRLK
jgi:hypothetical protein